MDTQYEAILEPTDTWAIFDKIEGVPAMINDRLLIGLTLEEAEQTLAVLNVPRKIDKKSAA